MYDLTTLLAANYESELCDPLTLAAGKDISHWFDNDTRDPKTFVNPKTSKEDYYCPTGRYLHIPADGPVTSQKKSSSQSWWRDYDKYVIGRLT